MKQQKGGDETREGMETETREGMETERKGEEVRQELDDNLTRKARP